MFPLTSVLYKNKYSYPFQAILFLAKTVYITGSPQLRNRLCSGSLVVMNLKLIFPEETGREYGVSSAEVLKNEKKTFVGKHTYTAVHRLVFLPVTSFPHYCDLSHWVNQCFLKCGPGALGPRFNTNNIS